MVTAPSLTLSVLQEVFAVCRLGADAPMPAWSLQGFFAITRTEDELSIVCPQSNVPPAVQAGCFEGDWRCLKIKGPLDFTLTGVLVAIAAPLAEVGLSLFAISTYETDYVLVKQADLDKAVQTLLQAGHHIV